MTGEKSVAVDIKGMTCQSCVQSITKSLGDQSGINSVSISLEKEEGLISYDSSKLTSQQVVGFIEDVGFEAALKYDLSEREGKEKSLNAINDRVEVVNLTVKDMVGVSSVNRILNRFSKEVGVHEVLVSLDKNEAQISYDLLTTNLEKIFVAFEEIGLEAFALSRIKEMYITVEGMTCQSCVKGIEANISQRPGVQEIKVSLAEKLARIKYRSDLEDPDSLTKAICDMGFDAFFADSKGQNNLKEIVIHIDGMTCQSCVNTIEGTISKRPGVAEIKVSLTDKCARVKFLADLESPVLLTKAICEMGFDAFLSNGNEQNNFETVFINVEGMTCQSCVSAIEGTISKRPGVAEIKVSLPEKQAKIKYKIDLENPVLLTNAICDMGFDAFLPVSNGQNNIETVVINVEGMTCHSCVNTIEGTISKRPGVEEIKVSLSEKLARIKYQTKLESPESLAEAICDMGFDAFYSSASQHTSLETTVIHIEGMTCQSCVKTIEGTMSAKSGITDIKVSLELKQAVVIFDKQVTSPLKIREEIEDMGFDAMLPDSGKFCCSFLIDRPMFIFHIFVDRVSRCIMFKTSFIFCSSGKFKFD